PAPPVATWANQCDPGRQQAGSRQRAATAHRMARAPVNILSQNSFAAPLDVFRPGWLMCHAAATAGVRRATTPTMGEQAMQHAIESIVGRMCVRDEEGNGHDAAMLDSYFAAKRKIQEWAAEYTIDVADAYRRLAEYFSQR